MKHKLKINVSNRPGGEGVMTLKNVSIREKILHFLFGENRKVTILVPGLSVDEVTIFEEEKGRENDE